MQYIYMVLTQVHPKRYITILASCGIYTMFTYFKCSLGISYRFEHDIEEIQTIAIWW